MFSRLIFVAAGIIALGYLATRATDDAKKAIEEAKRPKHKSASYVSSERSGGITDSIKEDVSEVLKFNLFGKPAEKRASQIRVLTTFQTATSARKKSPTTVFEEYYGDSVVNRKKP